MKPVCAKCLQFFKPKRNGVYIEEGRQLGDGSWAPYKLWVGDLYECRSCGAELVTGFGRGPLAEHYQPEYASMAQRLTPLGRVDDC